MLSVLSKTFIRSSLNRSFTPICVSIRRNLTQVEKKESADKKKLTLQKYLFEKCGAVINYFENRLEKRFPKTIQIYRIFRYGLVGYMTEMRNYILLTKKVILDSQTNLTREELQLMYTAPKDTVKLIPILFISVIPFAQYAILTLAYKYPRELLTSHFWTPQQKAEFALFEQKKRLKHNEPLFRCMQAEVENIQNPVLKSKWKEVIASLDSGMHPSTADIIMCSDIFRDPPYSLDSLKKRHIKELLAIHDISFWKPFKMKYLIERAYLILQMDRAVEREGGVKNLSVDSLQWALSVRGVNPVDMSMESMQNWLNDWIIVSRVVDMDNVSLLLHAPILLAYNLPNNWILIYSK